MPAASPAGQALAAKKDDTLRFTYDQAPESVDPYFNNVRIGVILGANVWDMLVYRDPNTNESKGQLARSWKQVDDRTIDFELREGIKFHNGEQSAGAGPATCWTRSGCRHAMRTARRGSCREDSASGSPSPARW